MGKESRYLLSSIWRADWATAAGAGPLLVPRGHTEGQGKLNLLRSSVVREKKLSSISCKNPAGGFSLQVLLNILWQLCLVAGIRGRPA